jgi:hypothetical protein
MAKGGNVMHRDTIVVALTLLVLAASAAAQTTSDVLIIPVTAHLNGLNGTRWVTDLTLYNPYDYELSVGLQFQEADTWLTPAEVMATRQTVVLAPGETRILEDLLPTLFELDRETKGWVLVITRAPYVPNPVGAMVFASTRIYNVGGEEGTYGQTVPAIVDGINVGLGSSFVTGARNDGSYRSNLGVVCLSLAVTVHYRVSSADGTVVSSGELDGQQLSMHQVSFEELGVGTVDGPLTVELWLDPADVTADPCSVPFAGWIGAFSAYVSKVDNLSGDAEFLPAIPSTPFVCE